MAYSEKFNGFQALLSGHQGGTKFALIVIVGSEVDAPPNCGELFSNA